MDTDRGHICVPIPSLVDSSKHVLKVTFKTHYLILKFSYGSSSRELVSSFSAAIFVVKILIYIHNSLTMVWKLLARNQIIFLCSTYMHEIFLKNFYCMHDSHRNIEDVFLWIPNNVGFFLWIFGLHVMLILYHTPPSSSLGTWSTLSKFWTSSATPYCEEKGDLGGLRLAYEVHKNYRVIFIFPWWFGPKVGSASIYCPQWTASICHPLVDHLVQFSYLIVLGIYCGCLGMLIN